MRAAALSVLLLLAALPAAGEWRQTATTATWYVNGPSGSARCETAALVPDAVAWATGDDAWQVALSGAVLFVADTGAGVCELRIEYSRAAGMAVIDAIAPHCSTATGEAADSLPLAGKSAAVDRCIKISLRSLVQRYQEATQEPPPEPEPLEATP